MVDWDEDGDVDLISGESDGHIHYYENIGTVTNPILTDHGHYNCGGLPIDVGSLAIPVINDWNEDGMKDMIVGNDPAFIRVYLNVNTNASPLFNDWFQMPTSPNITQIKNAPDIGDLNGDGLKDLAFGWWQGTVVYYPNSGTNANPIFFGDHELTAIGTTIDPGGWTHLELNDWDEDGDLDLVYGEWEGEVYIHYNLSGEFSTELTPSITPIQIPASGGSFDFNAALANNSDYNVQADAWTTAILPGGSETGALLLVELGLNSGGEINRDRTQAVPAAAPPGEYEYILRYGVYPDDAWAESSFPFTKLETGDGGQRFEDWICDGAAFDENTGSTTTALNDFEILKCYPNPFNASTAISFELRDASFVELVVYDVMGREVQTAVRSWQLAGSHEVVWDAEGMGSGVYFVRLTVDGGQSTVKKVMFIK